MINPIAGPYLAKALRDERSPQPLPRHGATRTRLRARFAAALGPRDPKPVLTTESEVRS
jgi:hypothetical protein